MKTILFLSLALLTSQVIADQLSPPLPDNQNIAQLLNEYTYTRAEPLNRPKPRYPRNEAQKRNEGWVKLSYIVEADGTVSNPVVEESSGGESFEKSALKTVKNWTFSPATKNGETIQQCHTSVQLDFMMNNSQEQTGASKKFVAKFKRIKKHLKQNEFEEAKNLLVTLTDTQNWNRYENAWYQLAKTMYASAINDNKALYTSVMALTNSNKHYLPDDIYLSALSKRFVFKIEKGFLVDALNTMERIKSFKNSDVIVNQLQPYADKAKALVESNAMISVQGEISSREYWYHKLSKNAFEVDNINGELSKVDIRCKNKHLEYTVKENNLWNIPADWGQCSLLIYGSKNTTFDLIEIGIGRSSEKS